MDAERRTMEQQIRDLQDQLRDLTLISISRLSWNGMRWNKKGKRYLVVFGRDKLVKKDAYACPTVSGLTNSVALRVWLRLALRVWLWLALRVCPGME
ncbi:hypothetical protein L1987_75288 [Smallanthus sonchifolius]|uniref:Uncharacterized protein n=1 Tax=Smallanthus sonchifolius TaxID=185202 RepID=A0ACB9A5E2_9ASTR|nr:hypothetical protein L1987_75288 [Smallanthus sonchifolius]